ncbi:MAG: TonB-dependent receptor [Elusimicrobia bacterium]|nr:TonB-dependent receptor [Elusimicrobiota bacterium]
MRRMKFTVSVLLLFISGAADCYELARQDNYLGDLGAVIVTPARINQSPDELPTNVSVITRQEMDDAGMNTLADAVEQAAGVIETGQIGTYGSERRISLRNGGSKQVLVMIDGRPVNELYRGDADLSEIPVDNIERVEIVKGPASALYGPNALGGVINVITVKPSAEGLAGSLYSSVGEYDFQNYRVNMGMKDRRTDSFFSFSRNISGGWRDNSACDNRNFSIRVGYDLRGAGRVSLSGGYSSQELELPGKIMYFSYLENKWVRYSDSDRYSSTPDALIEDEKEYGVINYEKDIAREFTVRAKTYGNNCLEAHADPSYPLDTESEDQTSGVELQADVPFGITMGGDLHEDRFQYSSAIDTAAAMDRKTYSSSFFIQEMVRTDRLTAVLGCRFDHHSEYDGQTNPRLSVVYRAAERAKLSLNAGRAFRAPTFGDLYAKVSGMGEGNPDLEPEKAWGYDLGLEYRLFDPLTGAVTLFRNDLEDYISWAPSPTEADPFRWTPENIGEVYSQGVEVEIRHEICRGISQKANYTYTDSRGKITDDELNTSKLAWGRKGGEDYETLKYIPENRLNYSVSLKTDSGFGAHADTEYVDKRWTLDGWDFNGSMEKELPVYAVTNAGISQKISDAEIFILVDNIFDTRYRARYEYPLPGRTVRGGVKLEF